MLYDLYVPYALSVHVLHAGACAYGAAATHKLLVCVCVYMDVHVDMELHRHKHTQLNLVVFCVLSFSLCDCLPLY